LAAEGLAGMIDGLIQSTTDPNSIMGQLVKNILQKAISNLTEDVSNGDLGKELLDPIGKFAVKWAQQIQMDLSKLRISEQEKKVALAIGLASVYTKVSMAPEEKAYNFRRPQRKASGKLKVK
jgi:hypothetical protein